MGLTVLLSAEPPPYVWGFSACGAVYCFVILIIPVEPGLGPMVVADNLFRLVRDSLAKFARMTEFRLVLLKVPPPLLGGLTVPLLSCYANTFCDELRFRDWVEIMLFTKESRHSKRTGRVTFSQIR